MALITTSLIAALAPAAIDAVKSLFGGLSRKIGGLSVEDELKLKNWDITKLETLAKLDNPGGVPSQWVVDTRASFRYIGAGVSILAGIGVIFFLPALAELGAELIAAPYAFIFGERLLFGLKGTK